MRAPRSTAKSLSGAQPIARPVKAPIGGMNLPTQAANLPQPIMPKIVRQPIQQQPVVQPVVQTPEALTPVVEPIAEKLVRAPVISPPTVATVQDPVLEPATTVIPVESQLEIEDVKPEIVADEIVPELESMDEVLDEALDAAMEDEMNQVQETVMLTPIKTLKVVEEIKTAVLKPVTVKTLTPVKRRGPPPSSQPGVKPDGEGQKEATASLKPITKLTPVSSPNTDLNIISEEEEN
jgi:hypothetical protein